MRILFLIFIFCPTLIWACPFCEIGSKDAAFFMFTIVGLFMVGFLAILGGFALKGGWKTKNDLAMSVLEAEGVTDDDEE